MLFMCLILMAMKIMENVYMRKRNERTNVREKTNNFELNWIKRRQSNNRSRFAVRPWHALSMLVNHNQMMVFMWVSKTKTKLCCSVCVCVSQWDKKLKAKHTLAQSTHPHHLTERENAIQSSVSCKPCRYSITYYTHWHRALNEQPRSNRNTRHNTQWMSVCVPFEAVFVCAYASIYLQFQRWYFDVLFLFILLTASYMNVHTQRYRYNNMCAEVNVLVLKIYEL